MGLPILCAHEIFGCLVPCGITTEVFHMLRAIRKLRGVVGKREGLKGLTVVPSPKPTEFPRFHGRRSCNPVLLWCIKASALASGVVQDQVLLFRKADRR